MSSEIPGWRAAVAVAGFALAAACAGPDSDTEVTATEGHEDTVEEERLLTPVDTRPEPEPLSLAPIGRPVIEAELEPGAGCSVLQNDQTLLVAIADDAIASPFGTLRHFAFEGTLAEMREGAVFTAGAITIEVTPQDFDVEQADEVEIAPALVVLREEGRDDVLELRAEWHCGA